MGPIERELRANAERGACVVSVIFGSSEAFTVYMCAVLQLTNEGEERWSHLWPEVQSEAIEAAEALGL